ncbi:hypothetical protein Curi_c06340 [Gottschalkia acidurici 9a]|uniref:Uncharacterized protein n=1 Tax=Gottschalkia acidurici (strain ATCC 7906 / DSM 604 / BCRC 14475 / CIP 104303 / KCTC 5404 / NCIMB 10678 / 9a) TaxID=1128398 RepID=K0AY60_GOTA9|nr:hypothetical protein [Gottschalkia acidurici]AFS77707.1 hypothetical protein Curi_c06340 [Gottschalkia acidurici 9a]
MKNVYDHIPYPELYYIIYPKVVQCMEEYFGGYEITHDISQGEIESLIDSVYAKVISECPEIAEDEVEMESYDVNSSIRPRPFFGRRRLLRDIAAIIFFGELFRRMGRHHGRRHHRLGHHSNYDYSDYDYQAYVYDFYNQGYMY